MRNLEICQKCNNFLRMSQLSEWNSDGSNIMICSTSYSASERWLKEEEYISKETPIDCKYKLEQFVISKENSI